MGAGFRMMRTSIWLAVVSGALLVMAALWTLFHPPQSAAVDLPIRAVLAAETASQWAILGVIGALLGNVLLFLNLRIAADATKAANTAAVAAKDAVDHAKTASGLELRPYIFMDNLNFDINSIDNKIQNLGIRLTWRNVGRTPASNLRTHLSYIVADSDFDLSKFHFPEHAGTTNEAGQIGQDQHVFTYSYFRIGIADLKRLFRKEVSIFLWASIEYDGLDPSVRHRTEWSTIMSVDADPEDATTTYTARLTKRHNGFDHDCVYRSQRPTSHGSPTVFPPEN